MFHRTQNETLHVSGPPHHFPLASLFLEFSLYVSGLETREVKLL